MFLNFSNHPSAQWSKDQLYAAELFGEVTDLDFPDVPPEWDIDRVCELADGYARMILDLRPDAVLCQGEMTLTYQIVKRLYPTGIRIFSACSDRISEETVQPDGSTKKISRFVFRRFRSYEPAD